jgi:ABC-2 type transport system ATP-binding protein
MTDLAIDITNASKTYKGGLGKEPIRALRGVDLQVGRGEVFGLLGPNGAGKSTLVKILMTVIRPSSVSGSVLGNPVADKQTLAKVGYLPEHHRFPDYLKGWQVLDFYGAMAGMARKDRKPRIDKLLDLVGMGEWAGKRIKQYSKGMRQRVGLAQALMNDPELVLLDEPTDGVDPQGRRDIREICQQLRDEGRTVFINSHLLSELEMVCDRVAIMVKGEVAQQGTIDELTEGQEQYRVELAVPPSAVPNTGATAALRAALPALGFAGDPPSSGKGTLPSGEWFELEPAALRVGTSDPETIRPSSRPSSTRGTPSSHSPANDPRSRTSSWPPSRTPTPARR